MPRRWSYSLLPLGRTGMQDRRVTNCAAFFKVFYPSHLFYRLCSMVHVITRDIQSDINP